MSAVSYMVAKNDEAQRKQQRDRIQTYARANALQVVDEFQDTNVLGNEAIDARPDGNRLMEEVKHGHFNAVIVDRLGSLSANSDEIMTFYRHLQTNGVELHAADIGEVNEEAIRSLA